MRTAISFSSRDTSKTTTTKKNCVHELDIISQEFYINFIHEIQVYSLTLLFASVFLIFSIAAGFFWCSNIDFEDMQRHRRGRCERKTFNARNSNKTTHKNYYFKLFPPEIHDKQIIWEYVRSSSVCVRLLFVMHSSFLGTTRVHLSSLHTHKFTSIWFKMKTSVCVRERKRMKKLSKYYVNEAFFVIFLFFVRLRAGKKCTFYTIHIFHSRGRFGVCVLLTIWILGEFMVCLRRVSAVISI